MAPGGPRNTKKTTKRGTRSTPKHRAPPGLSTDPRFLSTRSPPKGRGTALAFDRRLDWAAWEHAFKTLPRGVHPPDGLGPKPKTDAVRAARNAAGKPRRVDANDVKLAASLAARFSGLPTFYSGAGPGRWDLFVEALNQYPHQNSTACRWLAPALRNLLCEPRETPEELWDVWLRDWELSVERASRQSVAVLAGNEAAVLLHEFG